MLEIVPQGPVAEHLKEGEMMGIAHRLDVTGPDALLVISEPLPAGMVTAQNIRHQGVHACSGEKHCRIVFGNQGSPTDLNMVF
ncbi:hypothetical protein SDC9_133082 [bioreactor metagenome]|uniref:Uncharacterized protein n=1 Tax=bioreactor metagenome TaxID=1076179 RepID=A0A645D9Y8_9ZZZZ